MKARTFDDEPLFKMESDPTGCRPPPTPRNRPCHLKLVLNKNLMDDPERIILWQDWNLKGKKPTIGLSVVDPKLWRSSNIGTYTGCVTTRSPEDFSKNMAHSVCLKWIAVNVNINTAGEKTSITEAADVTRVTSTSLFQKKKKKILHCDIDRSPNLHLRNSPPLHPLRLPEIKMSDCQSRWCHPPHLSPISVDSCLDQGAGASLRHQPTLSLRCRYHAQALTGSVSGTLQAGS